MNVCSVLGITLYRQYCLLCYPSLEKLIIINNNNNNWAGTHVRRVGNNWRITLHMHYEKKARGEVLEHMVLHGIANLVVSLTYCLKKDAARGALRQKMKQSWNYTGSSTPAANSMRHSLMCRLSDTREGVTEKSAN